MMKTYSVKHVVGKSEAQKKKEMAELVVFNRAKAIAFGVGEKIGKQAPIQKVDTVVNKFFSQVLSKLREKNVWNSTTAGDGQVMEVLVSYALGYVSAYYGVEFECSAKLDAKKVDFAVNKKRYQLKYAWSDAHNAETQANLYGDVKVVGLRAANQPKTMGSKTLYELVAEMVGVDISGLKVAFDKLYVNYCQI